MGDYGVHDNDHCTGIAPADNLVYVAIMTILFTVEERRGWSLLLENRAASSTPSFDPPTLGENL